MGVSLGIALIVRNEAANMRRLLPILKPHFDQIVVVDTNSTDDTGPIAQELGADVYYYEGPYTTISYIDPTDPKRERKISFENVASFGDARAFAFSKLKTEWQAWCDADDEWVGLEFIRPILEEIAAKNAPINAIWTLYDYDQVEIGKNLQTIAVHRRERFVRAGTGWHWVRPVHEHMITDTPVSIPDDHIRVVHRRDRSKDYGRNERNIHILRRSLRENPKDARSWFDLATQYYNSRRLGRALACFRIFLKFADNDIEAYQAWHHAADCWRMMGQFDKAEICDKQALLMHTDWADAHYGLAENAFARGDFARCLSHVRMGAHCQKPNDFLVLNPLDYEWAPKVLEQRALSAQGHIPEALALVERILEIVPNDPEALAAKDTYERIIGEVEVERSALKIGALIDDVSKVHLFNSLPHNVRRQKPVRDQLLVGVIGNARKPDVVIFCGQSLEEWGPHTPDLQGIGGSETAVINVARELGELGVNVDIYNGCGAAEGKYGNVRYLDFNRYNAQGEPKLTVAWRNPAVGPYIKGDHRWLWMHDLHAGPVFSAEHIKPFTLMRPVSDYHGWFLSRAYPFAKDKIAPTRNGIDLRRFSEGEVSRNPHKVIYCSSPDRGLLSLLNMWPIVRRYVTDAELHIFYGWESFDRAINLSQDRNLRLIKAAAVAMLEQLKDQGVIHRGRINQLQLANEMRSAAVLAYPTQFLEVSCITAMETMASGAVVLSTIAGALPETVASGGLLVRGFPTSDAYQNVFTKDLIGLLTKPDAWQVWSARGLERAKVFPWKGVAEEWVERINA
jgi:tetratricopeptide (TPR) repeat protein